MMVFKNLCVFGLWTKVALALEELNLYTFLQVPPQSCKEGDNFAVESFIEKGVSWVHL